jgi:hypothetical protein
MAQFRFINLPAVCESVLAPTNMSPKEITMAA